MNEHHDRRGCGDRCVACVDHWSYEEQQDAWARRWVVLPLICREELILFGGKSGRILKMKGWLCTKGVITKWGIQVSRDQLSSEQFGNFAQFAETQNPEAGNQVAPDN